MALAQGQFARICTYMWLCSRQLFCGCSCFTGAVVQNSCSCLYMSWLTTVHLLCLTLLRMKNANSARFGAARMREECASGTVPEKPYDTLLEHRRSDEEETRLGVQVVVTICNLSLAIYRRLLHNNSRTDCHVMRDLVKFNFESQTFTGTNDSLVLSRNGPYMSLRNGGLAGSKMMLIH